MGKELDFVYENVNVCLNYGTVGESGADAIYIGTRGKYTHGEEENLAITVDEAKWLSEKLLVFVDAFNPKNRLDELIKGIEGKAITSIDYIKQELEDISIQMKK